MKQDQNGSRASARRIVAYRPLDGDRRDGLRISGGRLEAYRDGELVGAAQVSSSDSLEELLSSYRVPEMLSDLEFSTDGSARDVEVELEVDFTLGASALGSIKIDGERGLWEASRVGSNDLADPSLVPAGARPWAADEALPGHGWQIRLPAEARVSSDPTFRRRVALTIEAFLYALSSGREIQIPYRRRFSTVFSAADPMWAANVPPIDEGLPL